MGYEHSCTVTASTLEELRQQAQECFSLSGNNFRLYWCMLDEAGMPVDWHQRVSVDELARALERGGGVVWVSDGGSPQRSPQKEKPDSRS